MSYCWRGIYRHAVSCDPSTSKTHAAAASRTVGHAPAPPHPREASEILADRALGPWWGLCQDPAIRGNAAMRLVFCIAFWSEDGLSWPRGLFRRGLSLRSPPLMTLKKLGVPHVNNLGFSFLFFEAQTLAWGLAPNLCLPWMW